MTMLRLLAVAALLGALARPAGAAASLSGAEGVVQVRPAGSDVWSLLVSTGLRRLSEGDAVRTGPGASVVVLLPGAGVRLGPASEAALEGSTARPIVALSRGALSATFSRVAGASPRLQLSAGSVVPRAASTIVRVELGQSGRAVLEVARGAVVVTDARGGELVVNGGERVRLDLRGAGEPDEADRPSELERDRWRARSRRELGLDRAREGVLVSAVREARLGELREGRALLDSSGRRARVEQYVLRPTADSFRYVALNSREGRLDAFSLLGTFDRALPAELDLALAELAGRADAAPAYVMTSYETLRSNGIDRLVERAEGGHAVDLNANADPTDDVAELLDLRAGRIVDVTGRAVFKTLYDRYGVYANGALKRGHRGTNVESYDPVEAVPSAASGLDPITGAAAAVFAVTTNETRPDPSTARRLVYESYGDGSFLRWDLSAVDPEGAHQGSPLSFSRQESVSATEFGGRTIELTLPAALPAAAGLEP